MADWTDIPDSALEPGKPIRSIDALALRDNVLATAEGASGAPRIQTDAIEDDAVTADKLAPGSLNTADLNTDNDARDWVLARTAAASAGAVGTYVLAISTVTNGLSVGSTAAGSVLIRVSNASLTLRSPDPAPSGNLPGTWRAMHSMPARQTIQSSPDQEYEFGGGLFLRIS